MDSSSKKQIDALIPRARTVLEQVGIAQDGSMPKAWRGQVAAFGAAIALGSLSAAVAFFKDSTKSKVDRSLLIEAIYRLIRGDTAQGTLADLVSRPSITRVEQAALEREVSNAAIALKLAMNFYTLTD
ncbi:MAG: hypothetical protein LBD51_03135 [Bifidobacteriaceae bacterium]|jgi:hypothetical protein|nr:hypothetical protein [Bifidobacteriaceae bacterium]